jgi:methylmalonyl-CoA mutase N-terminal domain/subunit
MKRRIKLLREERNNGSVQKSLSELEAAAEGTQNLVPFVMQAVKTYATIGEICGVLRKVFGEYTGPTF